MLLLGQPAEKKEGAFERFVELLPINMVEVSGGSGVRIRDLEFEGCDHGYVVRAGALFGWVSVAVDNGVGGGFCAEDVVRSGPVF